MTRQVYDRMDSFRLANDDLPDGAFFAKAQEQGFDGDAWADWCDMDKKIHPEHYKNV